MRKIKQPSVAGTFYPAEPAELNRQIGDFEKNNKNTYEVSSRAVIVPHAGLVYSGRLAFEGINQLDKNIKNIFIIAPAHRTAFDGISLTGYDVWQTPLGEIEINQEVTAELEENYNAAYNDTAFISEHSVEIQLPLIQHIFKDVKIIPVLIGKTAPDEITRIISRYYPDKENGFVISSDLSHFMKNEDALRMDSRTAQIIEANAAQNLTYEAACGAVGIAGLLEFAEENKFSLIRIDMTNSSFVTGDKTSVVGYGCWFLYEGEKNKFLKKYYSDFILEICSIGIDAKLNNKEYELLYPMVFNEPGACFVTLEKFGILRGCIGSIIAHRTLIEDIILNAQNAAFNDPRFKPVSQDEIKDIKIAVSLLSTPKPIVFDGENDLLNKIEQNVDGIIIKDGEKQAVYLPSVWEQIPDKREFLNSLKVKAGMSPEYFSETFEAYRFCTEYIKK